MSLSNPKQVNPAAKFIQWKGDVGEFFYYDKEQEKKVTLQMPLYFVVLDELTTIKGYNQRLSAGIYSNEIRYSKDENLNVRSHKGGIQIVGKYPDIKDEVKGAGGKYCKSVYAMLIIGKDQYELVNFQFHGASFSGASDQKGCLSGWFNKKANSEQYGITVREVEQGQNGAVKFQAPVFEPSWKLDKRQDVLKVATEMDKKLQAYLKNYLSQVAEKEAAQAEELEPVEFVSSDPNAMAFEAEKWGYEKREIEAELVSEEKDDLPF